MRPHSLVRGASLQLAALLLAPSALGIVDLNFNGLSDSWEKTYNGNALFPSDFELTADPDQDGWTNENEAVAGTDPFDANPGPGMVGVQISHTAATFADTNSDGILEVITPAVCTLVWNSLPGKQYAVEYSPDLGSGTEWLRISSFTASQTQQTFHIQTSLPDGNEPPKGFWRVKVTDIDENGDGLTNYEAAYYGTNRFSRDSDGDGVSDWDEITKNLSSPLSAADGDTDGIPDDFEKNLSRKLLEGNPDPAAWSGVHVDLLAGNLDANHVYTGDGTTAGEVYGLVSGASYYSPESTEFLVESQVRWNNLDGDYTEPYGGNPGENSFVYTASAARGTSPFPVFTTTNLTQSESNAGYLTGGISGAAWDRFTTPTTVRLPNFPFGDLVASSSYLETDNLPLSFHCDGAIQHYRTRIIATDPAHQGKSLSFLRVGSWKPWGVSSAEFGNVLNVTPLTIEFTPGQMVSPWIGQAAPMMLGKQSFQYLVPLERAPDVLAVNSDFDEGRIDPATGFAIPDCDDAYLALEAERKHLDGKYAVNERITDDLHPGFFGVKPQYGGNDFWAGATVTIGKVDKIDSETGYPESGQIRLYGKWGNGASQYRAITPYDFETLDKTNLAVGGINGVPTESVYGTNSPFPSGTSYFIEGVRPGKITLEWRYQKGSVDVRYEQSFLVETRRTVRDWREEVRYQIRLQTYANEGKDKEVDVALYHPGNGFRNTSPMVQPDKDDNRRRVRAIYYYYRQLFQERPDQFMWAGMAKTAAAPIYAGMSDLTTLWQVQEAAGGYGAGTYFLTRGLLCGGQLEIFTDKAWAHRAYAASGIGALNWVEKSNPDATNFDAWQTLDSGVRNSTQAQVNMAGRLLLQREQEEVVQRFYLNYATSIWMNQPKSGVSWIDSSLSWLLGFEVVTESPGLGANVGEWLSANSKKNPMPGGPVFRDVVPGGRIDFFEDRWAWTSNPAHGMLEIWTGTATSPTVPRLNAAQRLGESTKKMYGAAIPYSHDPGGLEPE